MDNKDFLALPLENKGISNIFLGFIILSMGVSIWALIYTTKFMKLNRILKSLLMCSFLHHFIHHMVNFWSLFHLTYITNQDDDYTCLIISLNNIVIFPGHYLLNTMISVVKFYILWKTKHQKIPNVRKIIGSIITGFIIHFCVKAYLAYFHIAGSLQLFKVAHI